MERTPPAAGMERVAAAGRLCMALGAMEASADELVSDGPTPLTQAAANCAGARVLQSLVAAWR